MTTSSQLLQTKLAVLRNRFVLGIPERLSRIEQAIRKKDDSLEEAERELHNLAGTAGTYRLHALAEAAREAELTIAGSRQELSLEDLLALVERIRAAADDRPALSPAEAGGRDGSEGILVVGEVSGAFGRLVQGLAADGLEITTAAGAMEAGAILTRERPAVVLTNLASTQGETSALVEMTRAQGGDRRPVVLCVGKASTFSEQVRIARSADACFSDAEEVGIIQIAIQEILGRGPRQGGKILCVDDDKDHSDWVASVLNDRGYEPIILNDPADFDSVLERCSPDLILLDVVMPEISGMDLARYARQHAAHVTTPIIFLTAQGGVETRIEGARVTADDFLVKPLAAELLISVVEAKLRRARLVRALIDYDGLTGALRPSAFDRQIEAAIASDQVLGERSALVFLDLDHFKRVNDQFGHAVGDGVLASFAAFLRRNVRELDAVGRCGGEEFGLLIRNIEYADCERIVARILAQFRAVTHLAPDGAHCSVTFSAGIAPRLDCDDARSWKARADEALYRAKRNGRARIEAAA